MRRWIKRITLTGLLVIAVGSLAAWWAVRQTQHVPEFYARATKAAAEQTAKANRRMKADVQQLRDDAAKRGTWHAAFSDEEINAWLCEELPKKFPRLLAKGASEPRIFIEDNRLVAAVRYKDRRIDTVISCELEVELTEQPNMLALRVKHLKAGALPLPLSNFLKGISFEAAKGDIDIRWDVTESGPIALATVPSEDPRYVLSPVVVESVQLVDGALILSGHTGPMAEESYQPLGPVYRFVSYRPGENRNHQTTTLSSRRRDSRVEVR